MLIELVNLHTLLLVHLMVLQISVNLSNSLPLIYILLIPIHLRSFLVASHLNIHRERKWRESVLSSSFVNSINSHDTANKVIVGRNRIYVLTKPGNYYISSIFFLSALFWEFLMLGIFVNNIFF